MGVQRHTRMCSTWEAHLAFLRAFDTRKMKTILHTYKGFTGGVSDIVVDNSGKCIFTARLDGFVRVHFSQTTPLQYQCYVKIKSHTDFATRLI